MADSYDPIVTTTVTAGALVRRHLRVVLDTMGLTWVEHRGWLDSSFIISADRDQWTRLHAWMRRVNDDA